MNISNYSFIKSVMLPHCVVYKMPIIYIIVVNRLNKTYALIYLNVHSLGFIVQCPWNTSVIYFLYLSFHMQFITGCCNDFKSFCWCMISMIIQSYCQNEKSS